MVLIKFPTLNLEEIIANFYFFQEIKQTNLFLEKEKEDSCDEIFRDLYKKDTTYSLIMKDFYENNILPLYTNISCWWCSHAFLTRPLGCPLKFYGEHECKWVADYMQNYMKHNNLNFENLDFFETEGIFCSFSCILSYILDKGMHSKYKNSISYLYLLRQKIYNSSTDMGEIKKSPPWKMLKKFGGSLNIKEFRNSTHSEYTETINTKRPFMLISSQYIEKEKFPITR